MILRCLPIRSPMVRVGVAAVALVLAAMYRFMQKVRPIQVGELKALDAISVPRPAGAARALTLFSADIAELDQGLAAYRAGNRSKFLERALAWSTDNRARNAFKALGAPTCA